MAMTPEQELDVARKQAAAAREALVAVVRICADSLSPGSTLSAQEKRDILVAAHKGLAAF